MMDNMTLDFEEVQPVIGGTRIEAYFWGSASVVRDDNGEPYIADIAIPGTATDTVVTPAGRRAESGEDAVVHLGSGELFDALCVALRKRVEYEWAEELAAYGDAA